MVTIGLNVLSTDSLNRLEVARHQSLVLAEY